MAQILINGNTTVEELAFADEVHDMGDYIVGHPEILGSDVRIVARELQVGTNADSRRIDFLCYDTELNQILIVELKKEKADEKVLLQTLRYGNWIRNNPDSVRYQIKKQGLDINEEEVDSENIKIMIVAPKIAQALAELCQYMTAFEFEFVQLQRFKDSKGAVYAIADRVEIESSVATPSKSQGNYDLDWFGENKVREPYLTDLKTAVEGLERICQEQNWDLKTRYVKWAIRFQTNGGRNAFYIAVRRTQKHYLRLALGTSFRKDSVSVSPKIEESLEHKKASPDIA